MKRDGRDDFYPSETGVDNVGTWTPSRHTKIVGNSVHDVIGGGIAEFHSKSASVSRNHVVRAAHGRTVPDGGNVAIWWEGTDDIRVKRNTVSKTGFNEPSTDGTAFDADANSHRSIVEYNRSYHNDGGFFIAVSFSTVTTKDTIVRHNTSRADGYATFQASSATRNTRIEANSVHIDDRTIKVRPPSGNEGSYPMSRVVKIYNDARSITVARNTFINKSHAGYDKTNGEDEQVANYRHNIKLGGKTSEHG